MLTLDNVCRHRADGEEYRASFPLWQYARTDEIVIGYHRDHPRTLLMLLRTYEIPLSQLVPVLHCELPVANPMNRLQGMGVRRSLGRLDWFGYAFKGD